MTERSVIMIKYIFIAIYIVFIVVIGIRSRKASSAGSDGYLLGGRSIGPFATAFSFAATYVSGVCLVNAGQIGWNWGIGAIYNAWGNVLLSIMLSWMVLGRKARTMSINMNVQTLPDFLCTRYKTQFFKSVGSVVIFVFMVPYTAAVFSSLSYMFQTIFNINYEVSVIVMAALAAFYLAIGGYKAAAKIDLIQGSIMIVGGLAIAYFTLKAPEVGGLLNGINKLKAIPEITTSAGVTTTGEELASFSLGGNWQLLAGLIPFVLMTSFAPNGLPHLATKFFAIKDEKSIKVGTITCTIIGIVILTAIHIPGYFVHLFYPDGLPAGGTNLLVPNMLTEILPEFWLAVVLLLILSASMSTLAGLVLASTSALGMDFIKGYIKKDMSDKSVTTLMRILSVVFVALALVLALLNLGVISSIQSLAWGAMSGFFLSPYLYSIIGGKRTSSAAAITGGAVGISCALLIPTVVKAVVPASIAVYCTTVNACAVALILPLIVVPCVSIFTKKPSQEHLEFVYRKQKSADNNTEVKVEK